MGRIVPEINQDISQQIDDKTLVPKKLWTRRNFGLVRLPAQLEFAAQNVIKRIADSKFRKDARQLYSIMYNLKLPDDRATVKRKRSDIKTELEIRDKIKNRADYDPSEFMLKEDGDIATFELSELIKGTLEDRRRDWHYYEYDEYASNLYMATRLAPNYACLKTIMNEIQAMDPAFEPNTVLDFGSGMGTTIWAVNETWPNTVREYLNVELSKDQQYLCENMLRGASEFGDLLPGVYHRQYLPTSGKTKYDMVVAAFTLLELPNSELRTQTIENLWNKTNDLLVIVERGNKGGFDAVNEARSFILDISGHDTTKKINFTLESRPNPKLKPPESHILAPCPHELTCPKIAMPSKNKLDTCRFQVVFEPLELGQRKSGFLKEEFSYIVMRKSPHPSYFNPTGCMRWPRVVDKRKRSSGHTIHKLCCPNGNLAETIITAKRYGKAAREIAKSCDWGDMMPIKVKDTYISKSSSFNSGKTESDHVDDKSHDYDNK